MIDSLSDLNREHNGPAAILSLNNFSFKYKILFRILDWNEHSDDSIVTCLGSIQTFLRSELFIPNKLFKDLWRFNLIWYVRVSDVRLQR